MKDRNKQLRDISSILIGIIGLSLLVFVLYEITVGESTGTTEERQDRAYERWCEYYGMILDSDPQRCYNNYTYEQDDALGKCYGKMNELYSSRSKARKKTIINDVSKEITRMNTKDAAFLKAIRDHKLNITSPGLYQSSMAKVKEYTTAEFKIMMDIEELLNEL